MKNNVDPTEIVKTEIDKHSLKITLQNGAVFMLYSNPDGFNFSLSCIDYDSLKVEKFCGNLGNIYFKPHKNSY